MKAKRKTHYSLMDELIASDTQPMSQKSRTYQATRMLGGLHEMMHAEHPSADGPLACM